MYIYSRNVSVRLTECEGLAPRGGMWYNLIVIIKFKIDPVRESAPDFIRSLERQLLTVCE